MIRHPNALLPQTANEKPVSAIVWDYMLNKEQGEYSAQQNTIAEKRMKLGLPTAGFLAPREIKTQYW